MWTNYRNKIKNLSRIDVKICLLEKIVKNTFVQNQQICLYQHLHYYIGNIFTGDLRILWRIVIFLFLDKLRTRSFWEQKFPNYGNLLQFMTMLRWTFITFSATIQKRNLIPSFWCIIPVNTVESYFYTKRFLIAFKFGLENAKNKRTLRS